MGTSSRTQSKIPEPRVPDCRICCLDPGRDLLRLRAQATGQAFIKGFALESQLEPLVSWILVGTIVRLCGLCSIDSILNTAYHFSADFGSDF